jgi:hypothetical protein
MSKANQVVIDNLKEMRVSGLPVWVTFKGLRMQIRPLREDDDFEPAQAALFKNRGRLHVALLSGKCDRGLYVADRIEGGPKPPPCSLRLQCKSVLAIIETYHTRAIHGPEDEP